MQKTILLFFCMFSSMAIFAQNAQKEGDTFAAAENFEAAAVMYRICMESDEACTLKLFSLLYENKIESQYSDELYQLVRPLAEETKNAEAQYYLGMLYFEGIGGVSQDDMEAISWLRKSADQGNAKALKELDETRHIQIVGDFLVVLEEYDKAAEKYRLCMESSPQCLFKLFRLIYNDKVKPGSQDELYRLIRPLADKDDPEAQYYLALLYLKGKGGVRQNVDEAEKWLNKSAGQNYEEAFRELTILIASRNTEPATTPPATSTQKVKPERKITANATAKQPSKALFAVGGIAAVAGAAATYLLPPKATEDWSHSSTTGTYLEIKKHNPAFLIVGGVIGVACIGTGIYLKKNAARPKNSLSFEPGAAQSLPNHNNYMVLNVVATGNGACFRLTF